MKSIKYLIVLSLTVFLAVESVQAQSVSKTGTTAAEFLNIPVGARAAGLGGAIVASANDASAMTWNPAAITKIEGFELMVDHAQWFADLRHSYLGVVMPAGNTGTFGINITALTMDDMEETTYDMPDGTGRTFGAYMYAAGFSYARNLLDVFSMGINIKYVNETIWNTSATGVAIDIGTLYETPLEGLVFGVSVTNFGSKMRMLGDDLQIEADPDRASSGNWNPASWLQTSQFDMPLQLRASLKYDYFYEDFLRVTPMVEGNSPSNNFQSVSFGLELGFLDDLFQIRGGIPEVGLPEEDRIIRFAAGAGVNYAVAGVAGLSVNYAYQQYQYLGGTNRVSLNVSF